MNSLTLQAPAKLNLSLRILGERDDGFHEIDTVMVKLPQLFDHLEFRESFKLSFECSDLSIPCDEQNLVIQAVRAYESAVGISCKWAISLKKQIPHGAGLAGGSSDAASTLLGLNRIHNFKLDPTSLYELAASLGSDIPFFLTQGASRCTGRGEKIEAIQSPRPLHVLLLKPLFAAPTADAFKNWKHSLETQNIHFAPQDYDGLTFANDLERPVFEKHRFLGELKQWLLERRETRVALMSGSGSTIFAVLHEGVNPKALAHCARQELDSELWYWAGFTE